VIDPDLHACPHRPVNGLPYHADKTTMFERSDMIHSYTRAEAILGFRYRARNVPDFRLRTTRAVELTYRPHVCLLTSGSYLTTPSRTKPETTSVTDEKPSVHARSMGRPWTRR
jgi:hypothetical protein